MYQHYLDKSVRDLAWVLDERQDLLRTLVHYERFRCFTPLVDRVDWLDRLQREPRQLHDWLQQRRGSRLGLYFEQLIAFYLQHHPEAGPRLWRRNLPVRTLSSAKAPGRTIGELDFLLCDDSQVIHLEVAVKFYLGHNQQWLGPNSRDTWEKKRDRMAQHQLPLSDLVVPTLLPQVSTRKFFWVKGHLFRHWLELQDWPDDTLDNKPALWLYLREAPAFFAERGGLWVPLERTEWLGAAGPNGVDRALQPETLLRALLQHVSSTRRGIMLSCGEQDCPDCERLFIVPDDWPAASEKQRDHCRPESQM